jgi:hypothetical protein
VAGRIVYLESDDEITSAAARIRDADSDRVAVVLPYGSRVATSRINFRLLSRDALTHDKRLAIVSGDPATRALAASAGLPVFSSVSEYESSYAGVDDEPRSEASVPVVSPAAPPVDATPEPKPEPAPEPKPRPRRAKPAAAPPGDDSAPDGTLGLVVPAAAARAGLSGAPSDTVRTSIPRELGPHTPHRADPAPAVPTASAPKRSTSTPGQRVGGFGGIRTQWLIGGAILALAILVGGVGIYVLLPSATIVVTPRAERITPIPLTVLADTTTTEPDAVRGVVPATEISIPVSVNDTFSATGKRIELTKATGTVRFENLDPTSTNRIAAGSIVRTNAGIRFRTQVTITVPAAELVGLTIFPSRASVKVTAFDGGPDSNVEANTIVVVPPGENSFFLKVSNPDPTSGGSRQEFARVVQADIDAALAALALKLQQAFQEAMADPALETNGATVFPSTGRLGEPTPDVATETLVGQEVPTFALALSATGTVTAVDSAPVSSIAETQLRAAVTAGHELVPGSVEIVVGDAVIVGQSVSFPVQASAQQIAILDPAALKASVLGKSIADAKATLAAYGAVEITISPDWTDSVPGFDSRVTLTIDRPVQVETPQPTATKPATPAPTQPVDSAAP